MPVSASFPLLPEPVTGTPPGPAIAETEGPARGTGNEFLGFGLLRPFRRDLKVDFASADGERLVRSAVGQILGTMAGSDFTQGELPWRTEFGSLLHLLRHQRNDVVLQELARVYVVDALKRWEPRVIVTSVKVTRERQDGENVLAIRLRYNVISANVPGNNVLIEGVEQVVRT
ncbi:MAG TPA: GPW/gp25 family protein [Polyangiaceae bacterium]|nr:GPW/gp25 family protein [Polyangiaceae bacterium]